MVDGTASEPVLNDPAEEVRVGALDLLRFGRDIRRETYIQLDGTRVPHEQLDPLIRELILFGIARKRRATSMP